MRTILSLIYILIALFEPAALDIGVTDNKLGTSAIVVKFISAIVFVFALVLGGIKIVGIVNYIEFKSFFLTFAIIGLVISLLVVFIITRPLRSLRGNGGFLFYTLTGLTLLTPASADYLNKKSFNPSEKSGVYELRSKTTKSERDMFSWIYLKNSSGELKVNISKDFFKTLKLKDKVIVNIKKGLIGFEYVDLVRRTNNIANR